MSDAVLGGFPPAAAEAFVAACALLGEQEAVRELAGDVPIASAIVSAPDRAARARLIASAVGRVARELMETGTA